MFRRQQRWCALLAAVCMLIAAGIAMAQPAGDREGPPPEEKPPLIPPDATPEQIVTICVEKATEIANRAVDRNGKVGETAVALIEELLDEERDAEATMVARWSVHWIKSKSERAGRHIHGVCRHCTGALIKAGGSLEMVEAMHEACRDQAERIRESAQAAVEAIHELVPPPDDAPPPPGDDVPPPPDE